MSPARVINSPVAEPDPELWLGVGSLHLDAPGLFFVEARRRIGRGAKELAKLQLELQKHRRRLVKARATTDEEASGSAWVNVIQGVGSFEPVYGRTISELLVADVLLVTAAEAYINNIAAHVLPGGEAEHFDKLTPVGKWLFLPKVMKLKWKPTLATAPLQQFATLVARRNKVIHPKVVQVKGVQAVEEFLSTLRLDTRSAYEGLEAVHGLIRKLSLSWRGSYGPNWLEEAMAKKQPPCFVTGGAEFPGRLGRLSARRRRAGV